MHRNQKKRFAILMAVALCIVSMFVVHGAVAQDNPPGCNNPVPGPDGFKNPNCHPVDTCNDGVDNDGDGPKDGADSECTDPDDGVEDGSDEPVDTCNDGVDNDGDGPKDGADPECTDPNDGVEDGSDLPVDTCNDGVDNDGDGPQDGADSECTDPTDGVEDGSDTGGGDLKSCEKDGLLADNTIADSIFGPGLDEAGPISGAIHPSALEGIPAPVGRPVVHEVNCVVAAVEQLLGINPA